MTKPHGMKPFERIYCTYVLSVTSWKGKFLLSHSSLFLLSSYLPVFVVFFPVFVTVFVVAKLWSLSAEMVWGSGWVLNRD